MASLSPIPKFTTNQIATINAVIDKQRVGCVIVGDGSTVYLLANHWRFARVLDASRVPLFKSKMRFKPVYIYRKIG